MSDDWEDLVIETGVDTLLNYLSDKGKATVSEISEDLGVSEDRIKDWADALESNDFLDKDYSARHGMVLKYTKKNNEKAKEKLDEVKDEVEEKKAEIEQEMESKKKEIKESKNELQEMKQKLESNKEEEKEIEEKIKDIQEMESELEDKLEEAREKEQEIHSSSVSLISRIDSKLNKIREANEKADKFEEREAELEKKFKAVEKLEKNTKKKEKLEHIDSEQEQAYSLLRTIKSKLSLVKQGGNKKDPEMLDLLDGNVNEVKNRLDKKEKSAWKTLLQLEKANQDRKTVKDYLEKRLEDE